MLKGKHVFLINNHYTLRTKNSVAFFIQFENYGTFAVDENLELDPNLENATVKTIRRKTDKGSDHLLEKANFDEFSNCIHIQVLYIKF